VVGTQVTLRQNATERVWPQIQSQDKRRMFSAAFRSRVRNTRVLLSELSHSSHTRHLNSFFTWESSFVQSQHSFDVRNSLIETVSKCHETRRRMPTPLVGTKRRICVVRLHRHTPRAHHHHTVVASARETYLRFAARTGNGATSSFDAPPGRRNCATLHLAYSWRAHTP
jgi:hypothetical protein